MYFFDEYEMMSSTRGVLVTGEDTCKQMITKRTIERTRRRVSSAMFVSFGVSLGGAVGPIEDGTACFRGSIPKCWPPTCTMILMDVMICTCGAHNLRKHACEESKEYLNRVDDAPAWRASRRLDGPSADVFAGCH